MKNLQDLLIESLLDVSNNIKNFDKNMIKYWIKSNLIKQGGRIKIIEGDDFIIEYNGKHLTINMNQMPDQIKFKINSKHVVIENPCEEFLSKFIDSEIQYISIKGVSNIENYIGEDNGIDGLKSIQFDDIKLNNTIHFSGLTYNKNIDLTCYTSNELSLDLSGVDLRQLNIHNRNNKYIPNVYLNGNFKVELLWADYTCIKSDSKKIKTLKDSSGHTVFFGDIENADEVLLTYTIPSEMCEKILREVNIEDYPNSKNFKYDGENCTAEELQKLLMNKLFYSYMKSNKFNPIKGDYDLEQWIKTTKFDTYYISNEKGYPSMTTIPEKTESMDKPGVYMVCENNIPIGMIIRKHGFHPIRLTITKEGVYTNNNELQQELSAI